MAAKRTVDVLALLAAAHAELHTELVTHSADWDTYDALPGDERQSGRTAWKSGTVGNLKWSAFRPHGDRPTS